MEETTPIPAPQPQNSKLSKEERSKIMRDAATRRWAKAKRASAKPVKAASKAPQRKKSAGPREFTSALKTAEKRLAKAILERAEHAAKYAVLSAEIPSLQRLIVALRNPLGTVPEYGATMPPTLSQIVGDEPLGYQNPPRREVAAIPVPQQLHPANTQARAGGGAVGVELVDTEDEDRFLKDSGVAGGNWH